MESSTSLLMGARLLALIAAASIVKVLNPELIMAKLPNFASPIQFIRYICLSMIIFINVVESNEVNDLREQAMEGDLEAQAALGRKYFYGEGVSKSEKEALYWYLKAAENGHPKGQYSAGIMLMHGIGVERDDAKGLDWLTVAAIQGLDLAQYNLGVAYRDGSRLVKSDLEAAKWFKRASDQGLIQAKLNLGNLYLNGAGVEQDDEKAFQLFKDSAGQGMVEADANLGLAYLYGWGVGRNKWQAIHWLRKASDQGDLQAQVEVSRYLFLDYEWLDDWILFWIADPGRSVAFNIGDKIGKSLIFIGLPYFFYRRIQKGK